MTILTLGRSLLIGPFQNDLFNVLKSYTEL